MNLLHILKTKKHNVGYLNNSVTWVKWKEVYILARPNYAFEPDERLLLKAKSVRHGNRSDYSDELVLTNKALFHSQYGGVFGNYKGTVKYPLESISQAIVGEAKNGGKQLEIYFHGGMDYFRFQSDNTRELKIWAMAITDQRSGEGSLHDYDYYQQFLDENLTVEPDPAQGSDSSDSSMGRRIPDRSAGRFVGDVAKSVLFSGNFTPSGIAKGVVKAAKKQTQREIASGLGEMILGSELGDELTEIQNEFREAFGLKRKPTQKEIRERQLDAAFEREVARARADEQKSDGSNGENAGEERQRLSVEKQIEMLGKLKELLDAEIITVEEFEQKKKEILGL